MFGVLVLQGVFLFQFMMPCFLTRLDFRHSTGSLPSRDMMISEAMKAEAHSAEADNPLQTRRRVKAILVGSVGNLIE